MPKQVSPEMKSQLENRFSHHPPVGNQAEDYQGIRRKAMEFAEFIVARVPDCAERDQALNGIDQAMFNANAGIARNPDAKPDQPEEPEAE